MVDHIYLALAVSIEGTLVFFLFLTVAVWRRVSMSLLRILALWVCMIALMFFVHEYEIFTVFLLRKVCRGLDFGKCLSMRARNCFPTLVFTA